MRDATANPTGIVSRGLRPLPLSVGRDSSPGMYVPVVVVAGWHASSRSRKRERVDSGSRFRRNPRSPSPFPPPPPPSPSLPLVSSRRVPREG